MLTTASPKFRLRSFVRRDSRRRPEQIRAFETLWPKYGLDAGILLPRHDMPGRVFLEIGFGFGHSLLALAESEPDDYFIGVETHKPGIDALLKGIEAKGLNNLRIYYGDVLDILNNCFLSSSLDGIQIFFPDPWPKRRHHARRLIQSEFLTMVVDKLKQHGTLHLATDWKDYANHMMQVLALENGLFNHAGLNQFAARSPRRPILTKFENRALCEGREIWDLQFQKR